MRISNLKIGARRVRSTVALTAAATLVAVGVVAGGAQAAQADELAPPPALPSLLQTVTDKIDLRYTLTGKYGYGDGAYASGYSASTPATLADVLGVYDLSLLSPLVLVYGYDSAADDAFTGGATWDTTKVWIRVFPAGIELSMWNPLTGTWDDYRAVETLDYDLETPSTDVAVWQWGWDQGPFGGASTEDY